MAGIDWKAPVPKGFRRNDKGDLVRTENIRQRELDEDLTVRRIHRFGVDISDQMARFRAYTLDDILAHVDRVIEEYGGKIGGKKGNVQLTNFEGTVKVQLAKATFMQVGPEIEAAQAILDELVQEWKKGARYEFQALATSALKPNANGEISVGKLLELRRTEIDDPRWRRLQQAAADSLRARGSAEYVRIYERDDPEQEWRPVPLSIQHVKAPTGQPATARGVLKRRLYSAIEDARHMDMTEGEIKEVFESARMLQPRKQRRNGAGNGNGGGPAAQLPLQAEARQ